LRIFHAALTADLVMRMVTQLLVAAGISILNISLHALASTWVIALGRGMKRHAVVRSSFFLVRVMILTVSVLMLAHFLEVCVWALAYSLFGVMPTTASASSIYFAFVNYTTLGYGDIVPVERWNLIGPATAMNGVLLFGWSTAVIFEILRRTLAASTPDPAGIETAEGQPITD
jgi:hypothetical protein